MRAKRIPQLLLSAQFGTFAKNGPSGAIMIAFVPFSPRFCLLAISRSPWRRLRDRCQAFENEAERVQKLKEMKAKWNANKPKLKACRQEVKAKGLAGDDRWFYIADCMDKT
jgi:hypothetical protein